MATIYKPTYTTKDKHGRKVSKKAKCWYVRYKDADGKTHQVKGYTDKGDTQQLAAKLQKQARHEHIGLADPHEDHRRRPIAEHVDDFRQHLEDKDRTEQHVGLTVQRVTDVVEGIGAKTISDIDGGRVASYLKDRRDAGLATESSNHYLRAVRNFCRWLVKDRRVPVNPVQHVSTLKADADRRHLRRVLSEAEFGRLIESTRTAKPRMHLSGLDRAMLYITAAHTGLRARELASLTLTAFDFECEPATLTVGAVTSKHREEDMLPLRSDVASMLRDWMKGKPADDRLWPGKWRPHAADMIHADLEAAGVEYADQAGRVADFHSLRHMFVTNLARAKVHPKVAQALARHKTLAMTMNVYTHTLTGDLAEALEKLPAPPAPSSDPTIEAGTLAATGTDDAEAGEQKACTLFAPDPVFDCHSVASDGTTEAADPAPGAAPKSLDLTALDTDCHTVAQPGRCGGIGRRDGFKIRSRLHGVWVRVPPPALGSGVAGGRTSSRNFASRKGFCSSSRR